MAAGNLSQFAMVEMHFVIVQHVKSDLAVNAFAWGKIANHDDINSHPFNWYVDFRQFNEIVLVGLKTHKIGSAATTLA